MIVILVAEEARAAEPRVGFMGDFMVGVDLVTAAAGTEEEAVTVDIL